MKKNSYLTAGLLLLFIQVGFSQSSLETLSHDGVERSYVVYMPQARDTNVPTPLLIALHGAGSNGADIAVRGRVYDTAPKVFVTDGADQQCPLTELGRKKLEPGGQVLIGYDISTADITFEPRAVRIIGTSNAGPRGGFEFGSVNAVTQ